MCKIMFHENVHRFFAEMGLQVRVSSIHLLSRIKYNIDDDYFCHIISSLIWLLSDKNDDASEFWFTITRGNVVKYTKIQEFFILHNTCGTRRQILFDEMD